MSSADLLIDAYERIHESVRAATEGLSMEQLHHRLDPEANTLAWLVWHLARVQDDHVAGAFDSEQVWVAQGWAARFGLALEPGDIGYGHTAEEVARVRAPAELLLDYYEAVHSNTLGHLRGLTDDDLNRVVDRSYEPPVTLAVRLVSVLSDDLQHVGQAAFLRGVLERLPA